jgi:hypothetical protein
MKSAVCRAKYSRLFLLVALSVVLFTETGCRPCDEATYENHCSRNGKAEMWCGEGRVRRERCSGDTVCEERNGVTACVSPSLTPCASGGTCATDAEVVEHCTRVGYYLFEECLEHEECVSEGSSAACVSSPPEACTAPLGDCSADGTTPRYCNSLVGYMQERRPCPENTACASNGKAATCVDPSLTPCDESHCDADGRTLVHCSLGYLNYTSVCDDQCHEHDPPKWGLTASCQP